MTADVSGSERFSWRRLGGGGIALGGALWMIASLVAFIAFGTAVLALTYAGVLLVGAGLHFLVTGERGSRGAAGSSTWAWIAVETYAAGYLILGFTALIASIGVGLPEILPILAAVLIVVGGPAAAFGIFFSRVVSGVPRWLMFAPAFWGIVNLLALFGLSPVNGSLLPAVLGALFVITGLAYLIPRPGER